MLQSTLLTNVYQFCGGTIRLLDFITTSHRISDTWLDKEHDLNTCQNQKISNVMENLSLHDHTQGGAMNNVPPGGPPHLPPQMFTTAAQLLDLTDKKLVLVLRDGRKLIGVLRSWDQFANLVLQDTIERIFVQDLYADISRGIFIVRGENVLLLGEIDLDKDDYIPETYRKASPEEVHALAIKEARDRKRTDKTRQNKLQDLGFEVEHTGEILF